MRQAMGISLMRKTMRLGLAAAGLVLRTSRRLTLLPIYRITVGQHQCPQTLPAQSMATLQWETELNDRI